MQYHINLHGLGNLCDANATSAYEQHKQRHTLSGARFKNSHFRFIVGTRLPTRAPEINVDGVSVCLEI